MPCSVLFNFLGRDFFNALAEKNADKFAEMLVKWLLALCAGIPVFVFRDYYQVNSSSVHFTRSLPQNCTLSSLYTEGYISVDAHVLVMLAPPDGAGSARR